VLDYRESRCLLRLGYLITYCIIYCIIKIYLFVENWFYVGNSQSIRVYNAAIFLYCDFNIIFV